MPGVSLLNIGSLGLLTNEFRQSTAVTEHQDVMFVTKINPLKSFQAARLLTGARNFTHDRV